MAFLICYGLYGWVISPMDLLNAPENFIQTMNNLFIDILDKVVNFLDDVLIYSNIVEEHFELLEEVCIHLYKHAFYCKLKKCSIFQKTKTFFGFNITPESMQIYKKWEVLRNDRCWLLYKGTVIREFCIIFIIRFSKIA